MWDCGNWITDHPTSNMTRRGARCPPCPSNLLWSTAWAPPRQDVSDTWLCTSQFSLVFLASNLSTSRSWTFLAGKRCVYMTVPITKKCSQSIFQPHQEQKLRKIQSATLVHIHRSHKLLHDLRDAWFFWPPCPPPLHPGKQTKEKWKLPSSSVTWQWKITIIPVLNIQYHTMLTHQCTSAKSADERIKGARIFPQTPVPTAVPQRHVDPRFVEPWSRRQRLWTHLIAQVAQHGLSSHGWAQAMGPQPWWNGWPGSSWHPSFSSEAKLHHTQIYHSWWFTIQMGGSWTAEQSVNHHLPWHDVLLLVDFGQFPLLPTIRLHI